MIRAALLAWVLCAAPSWAAGVGVIDVEAVLAASEQGQRARAAWQEALQPIEQDIQRLVQRGQSLELKLEQSVEAQQRESLNREMNQLRQQILRLQRQAQTRLTQLEDEFLAEQLPILEGLVIELAREQQIELVVRADAVVWGASSVNLSDDLLARYNQP